MRLAQSVLSGGVLAGSAVELAAQQGDLDMIKALVDAGAPIRLNDGDSDLLGAFIQNATRAQVQDDLPALMMVGVSPCSAVMDGAAAPPQRLAMKFATEPNAAEKELVRLVELAEGGCVSSNSVSARLRQSAYEVVFIGSFVCARSFRLLGASADAEPLRLSLEQLTRTLDPEFGLVGALLSDRPVEVS